MLLGFDASAHILNMATTVRGIVNMTAFAAVDAQRHHASSDPIAFQKPVSKKSRGAP
jgi:hypothetical protein